MLQYCRTENIWLPEHLPPLTAVPRLGLARFNADDSIDTSFKAYSVNNQFDLDVYLGIKLLADGTMYVFRRDIYITRIYLAFKCRRKSQVQISFSSSMRRACRAIWKFCRTVRFLYLGDFFDAGNHGSSIRLLLIVLRPTADTTALYDVDFFGANTAAKAVEIAADEKIIVGGGFTQISILTASPSAKIILSD